MVLASSPFVWPSVATPKSGGGHCSLPSVLLSMKDPSMFVHRPGGGWCDGSILLSRWSLRQTGEAVPSTWVACSICRTLLPIDCPEDKASLMTPGLCWSLTSVA